jgi:hypothetical protein
MGKNIFKDSFLKVEIDFPFKFHQGESPVGIFKKLKNRFVLKKSFKIVIDQLVYFFQEVFQFISC